MLRGCQKQMIVLQTVESSLFETAFFVLRRENTSVGADDMLAEANRIVGQGSLHKKKARRLPERFLLFLLGFFIGAGLFSLIYLFVFT